MRRWIIAVLLVVLLTGTADCATAPRRPEPVRKAVPSPTQIEWKRTRMYARQARKARTIWKRIHEARKRARRIRRRIRKLVHRVVGAARSQLGVPYVFATASPGRSFDCSGLTLWAASRIGRHLPHSAEYQRQVLPHISRENLLPGDLIFFSYGRLGSGAADHAGVYIGSGMMIDAGGSEVARRPVDWTHFLSGGRLIRRKVSAYT